MATRTKTRATDDSVGAFLAQVEDPQKRADSNRLIELMGKVTGQAPKLWGSSIVGFGNYHYRYASGTEGDSCLAGFSPRKAEFSIYLTGTYFPGVEATRDRLLQGLGKHRMGKGCLYVKRLDDIDMGVLERLVRLSVDELRKAYPEPKT
jgi:hypothetical protein